MRRTYKYRLYPTPAQEAILDGWLYLCRKLYNACLEQRQTAWKSGRHSLSRFAQQRELPDLKDGCPEFKDLGSHVLNDVIRRVETSFQRFFKQQAGYPKFKARDRYASLTFPDRACWKLDTERKRLILAKCGSVRIRLDRPVQGVIKTVTVKRTASGRWFVCFSCDQVPAGVYPASGEAVGIDLGISALVTTSTGETLGDTHILRRQLAKLRRVQRHMARQKKGSGRRGQTKQRVAHLHEHIADSRRDMHHKVSTALVRRYGLIAHEDISPTFMLANRHLARAASDAGWTQLLRFLQYKAAEAGRDLVAVNPHNTSQACSRCGVIVPKKLSVRVHGCPRCGLALDRDHNAAINILQRAQAEPTGANLATAGVA